MRIFAEKPQPRPTPARCGNRVLLLLSQQHQVLEVLVEKREMLERLLSAAANRREHGKASSVTVSCRSKTKSGFCHLPHPQVFRCFPHPSLITLLNTSVLRPVRPGGRRFAPDTPSLSIMR